MVHSPIAVHPEAADKDWAAPGTFPLLAPPRAAPPGWERIAPPMKEANQMFKNSRTPLPFIVLKREKRGKKCHASGLTRQLASSGEPARTSGAVREPGLDAPLLPARGGAGQGGPGAGPRGPARARGVRAPRSPEDRAAAERPDADPAPATSQAPGAARCRLRGPRGARGAGCRAGESAAAASNPPLSSLRLRHARSAAVAARRSPRGRGRARGERGRSPSAWRGAGRLGKGELRRPLGLLGPPR